MHTGPHRKYGYLTLKLALLCLVLSFLHLCFRPTTVQKCLTHLEKNNQKTPHQILTHIPESSWAKHPQLDLYPTDKLFF